MKKKEFNKVKSYTYLIIRKSDKKKYHGIRRRNCNLNISPINDLGIVYFTSGPFEKEFKANPNNFKFNIKHTFDHQTEAIKHEKKVNEILIRKGQWKSWINQSAFPSIILSDSSRKKLSEKTRVRVMGKNNPMYGKTHSKKAKEKISKISKITMSKPEMKKKLTYARKLSGYKHSELTKLKIRNSQLGSKSHLYGKPSTFKGKKHTANAKNKMSLSKLGKKIGPLSNEHKLKLSLFRKKWWAERRANV